MRGTTSRVDDEVTGNSSYYPGTDDFTSTLNDAVQTSGENNFKNTPTPFFRAELSRFLGEKYSLLPSGAGGWDL